MRVTGPDGGRCRIRRRWLPWRRRSRFALLKRLGLDNLDVPLGDDPVSTTIGLIVLAIFLVPAVIVLVMVLGEVVLLLLLLPLVVLARAMFGAPWLLQATHQREVVYEEAVKGWRASTERKRALAQIVRTQGADALWTMHMESLSRRLGGDASR